jgi:hypothetical protein
MSRLAVLDGAKTGVLQDVDFRRNWQSTLVPGKMPVRDLPQTLNKVVLPRRQGSEDRVDVIEHMRETLAEGGVEVLVARSPIVIHQATGVLLDGVARVSAIVAWAHAESVPGDVEVPVAYHPGSLSQAVADVIGQSLLDPQRRTPRDRLEALRTYIATAQQLGEPIMSQGAARKVFSIRPLDIQRVYREMQVEVTIGRNDRRYQAIRIPPKEAVKTADDRVVKEQDLLSSQVEDSEGQGAEEDPAWSAQRFAASSTPPEGALPADLVSAAADAEEATGELVAAIRRWLDYRSRLEATGGSLWEQLSDATAADLYEAVDELHSALRQDRRRKTA